MSNFNTFKTIAIGQVVAAIALVFPKSGQAAKEVKVTCDRQTVPTVTVTFSHNEVSQITPILSFFPEYFSKEEALNHCTNTAEKLNIFYSRGRMNYLASDAIDRKPVVCAVERRGLSCDSYSSEILFSLDKPVSPTELLYNMLGENFKGDRLPSSRTVSRIYTDLRQPWWPF